MGCTVTPVSNPNSARSSPRTGGTGNAGCVAAKEAVDVIVDVIHERRDLEATRRYVPRSEASTPYPVSGFTSRCLPIRAARRSSPLAKSSCTVGARNDRAALNDPVMRVPKLWTAPSDAVRRSRDAIVQRLEYRIRRSPIRVRLDLVVVVAHACLQPRARPDGELLVGIPGESRRRRIRSEGLIARDVEVLNVGPQPSVPCRRPRSAVGEIARLRSCVCLRK